MRGLRKPVGWSLVAIAAPPTDADVSGVSGACWSVADRLIWPTLGSVRTTRLTELPPSRPKPLLPPVHRRHRDRLGYRTDAVPPSSLFLLWRLFCFPFSFYERQGLGGPSGQLRRGDTSDQNTSRNERRNREQSTSEAALSGVGREASGMGRVYLADESAPPPQTRIPLPTGPSPRVSLADEEGEASPGLFGG